MQDWVSASFLGLICGREPLCRERTNSHRGLRYHKRYFGRLDCGFGGGVLGAQTPLTTGRSGVYRRAPTPLPLAFSEYEPLVNRQDSLPYCNQIPLCYMLYAIMSMLSMSIGIASPITREMWFGLDIENANTLGELLREKVEAFKGSPRRVLQTEVALDMGIDQGHLSKIVNDRLPRAAGRLQPEQVVTMLRGFRFSESEIREAALKFSLRLPREYIVKNSTPDPLRALGSLQSVTIQGVGPQGDLEEVEMPKFIVGDHNPEDVTVVRAAGDILACEEAKDRLIQGWSLLFDISLKPREGDTVLYKIQGHNVWIFRVWRDGMTDEVAVSNFNGKSPLIMRPGDPEVEFWGVKYAALDVSRDSDES